MIEVHTESTTFLMLVRAAFEGRGKRLTWKSRILWFARVESMRKYFFAFSDPFTTLHLYFYDSEITSIRANVCSFHSITSSHFITAVSKGCTGRYVKRFPRKKSPCRNFSINIFATSEIISHGRVLNLHYPFGALHAKGLSEFHVYTKETKSSNTNLDIWGEKENRNGKNDAINCLNKPRFSKWERAVSAED